MSTSDKNDQTGRFGGPGSSHQDREHPGKNHQPTGHKHHGEHGGDQSHTAPIPESPTDTDHRDES